MTREVISEKHDVELIYHGEVSCCDEFPLSLGRGLLGKGRERVSRHCFEGAMERGADIGWGRERDHWDHSSALPHICKFPSQEPILENCIGLLIFRGRVSRGGLRFHLGTGPWK